MFNIERFILFWVCAENRGEFLEKLQRVRGQVKTGTNSQPILTKSGPTRLTIGNWTLMCKKDGELQIQNSDGQQVTVFKKNYSHVYKHILLDCTDVNDVRKKYFTASSMKDLFECVDHCDVIDFINETNFFISYFNVCY